MLDKLKAIGAITNLMKNQDALRSAGDRVKQKLDQTRVAGEGGMGAVRVTASGSLRVLSVELSPALVAGMAGDDKTRGLASQLIADAVNDALAKAQGKIKEAVEKEAKEMGLEGMLPDLGALGLPGVGS